MNTIIDSARILSGMGEIALALLGLMEQVLKGKPVDEDLYARAFGSRDGMVVQLQKLHDLLGDMAQTQQKIVPVRSVSATQADEEERAMIARYIERFKAQREAAEASANADGAS